jgi:hypothetical protein
MSFVRSSKATSKVVVPVLLAGLLVTGIAFIEARPANAAACSTTATGYAGGGGTLETPFQISNAAELIRLSTTTEDWSSKHFVQTANIDLGNCSWTPIGLDSWFTGTYDGQGFTISGLDLQPLPAYKGYGLFGKINNATIKNLVVRGIIIAQQGEFGGIVGKTAGTSSLLRVRSEVDITHEPRVDGFGFSVAIAAGGIVGDMEGTLSISESSYVGTMTLTANGATPSGSMGGIIGTPKTNSLTITDSYSRVTFAGSTTTEKYNRGGLTGIKPSFSNTSIPTAVRNYSVAVGADAGISSNGLSSSSEGSFWDSQVGPAVSRTDGTAVPGTTAKTTSQLKTRSTFTTTVDSPSKELPTSWAIVQGWEAYNYDSPSNKWGICSNINDGYPFLLWEYASDPCVSVASAPSITSVTPASSSGSLSVAFTAPTSDGNRAISNYKYSIDNGANWVTRSPIATTSPLVIQGLTDGTSYQIKLLAINSEGDGEPSSSVTGTPVTTASAPTITAITASSESLSVAFTAPSSDGGAAISNYKYSLDNGATWITRSAASISSPLVITGLTNGTSYQVKLLAINSADDGASSAAVTATPISATPSQSPSPTSATPSQSPSPTSSPSSSVAPATTPASLTAPAATLAVTGSNLLGTWGFVAAALFIGLALLLVSGFRRRELDAK